MAARNRPQARDPKTGRMVPSWRHRGRTITWIDPMVPEDESPRWTLADEIVDRLLRFWRAVRTPRARG